MTIDTDHYSPAPDLTVAIRGATQARGHFAAEYGATRSTGAPSVDVLVDVHFARTLPSGVLHDGHKTVKWSVAVGRSDERPLRASIIIAGRPRRFALSMVQGYVVEPLVSLAAAEKGLVLLPAAALTERDRTGRDAAVIVLGRSRSGKTSVVVRAVAAGRGALGDDQVIVDGTGGVRSWPRRLRVYTDLRLTAPQAVSALPVRERAALTGLRVAKLASRGVVAPSLPLTYRSLGGEATPGPLPASRVVVVQRGGAAGEIRAEALPMAEVVRLAGVILGEQRARLRRLPGAEWVAAVAAADASEAHTLEDGLRGVPAEQWTMPESWDAPRSVSALAERLGVTGG